MPTHVMLGTDSALRSQVCPPTLLITSTSLSSLWIESPRSDLRDIYAIPPLIQKKIWKSHLHLSVYSLLMNAASE